jgi:hypothetical protein
MIIAFKKMSKFEKSMEIASPITGVNFISQIIV